MAESFGKNRERLETHDLLRKFMTGLLRHPKVAPLLSSEHFSVDGTLVEAWASHKSFRPGVNRTTMTGLISAANRAGVTLMRARLTPRRGFIARRRGGRPGSAIWVMR